MEATFKLAKYHMDDKGFWLSLNIPPKIGLDFLNTMTSQPYAVEIKRERKKRSLDANAYLWKLCNEIGNVLKASKEEVYLDALKKYGQTGTARINKSEADKLKRTFKYCEEEKRLINDDYVYYRFWVGSSDYDTKEMSILLDGVVGDAKELGINTLTPDEIANLKSLWAAQ